MPPLVLLIVVGLAIIAVISAIAQFDQAPHKVLHPSRQRRQPVLEIVSNRGAMLRIGENPSDPTKDAIPIVRLRQCITQPM